jgi:dihydropteroate synthase
MLFSMRECYSWRLSDRSIVLGDRTAVMGILNVTPDSFSDGGQYVDREKAVARGREMEQEGADIIDVGGESTRPGNQPVPEEEETRRVVPVIEALAAAVKIPISVDTWRAGVARRAISAGARIVNDISGLRFDPKLPAVIEEGLAGVILMHSRGTRETLHSQPKMEDPIRETLESLSASVETAKAAGIPPESIAVDPGFGFGKDAADGFLVLKRLHEFSKLGYPLLVGTSRKSFIRSIIQDIQEARTWGTAATVVIAIMNGAHIVRVHDVRQARLLADVTDRTIEP